MDILQQIFIEDNSFKELRQFLSRSFTSYFVLVDENTLQHCYPLISGSLPKHQLIQIASGEMNKTLNTCQAIWASMTNAGADRKSLCINLGGGVIGDMGGFAAACYKRGIIFINVPTTLLAMVDASVGSKTGIDFMGFKNQIGVFAQPGSVFIHTPFLTTLPARQLASGFAEVIKHYLIADSVSFNEILNSLPDINSFLWPQLVLKNIEIKAAIVEQDPFEKGARKALNFGHTIGHAIESWFLPDEDNYLLHGEAIAVGMIAESYISFKKMQLSETELMQLQKVILHYFRLPQIEDEMLPEVIALIKQDKKNENDSTRFTLLNGIGNYSIDNAVEEELISASLHYYNSISK